MREKGRQSVAAVDVEQPVGAPLAHGGHVGQRRSPGNPARSQSGRRGSCRWTTSVPSASTEGLSMADAELDVGHARGVRERVARGPVHLGGAAQRVRVLHLGGVVDVRGDDRRVAPTGSRDSARFGAGPRWGTQLMIVGDEDAVGAAQSLDRQRRGQVDRLQERSTVVDGRETSMPSMPSVPLMRARPSFSASSTGSRPAVAECDRRPSCARRRASARRPHPSVRAPRGPAELSRPNIRANRTRARRG